jgi:hypothetical protein
MLSILVDVYIGSPQMLCTLSVMAVAMVYYVGVVCMALWLSTLCTTSDLIVC